MQNSCLNILNVADWIKLPEKSCLKMKLMAPGGQYIKMLQYIFLLFYSVGIINRKGMSYTPARVGAKIFLSKFHPIKTFLKFEKVAFYVYPRKNKHFVCNMFFPQLKFLFSSTVLLPPPLPHYPFLNGWGWLLTFFLTVVFQSLSPVKSHLIMIRQNSWHKATIIITIIVIIIITIIIISRSEESLNNAHFRTLYIEIFNLKRPSH